MFQYGQLSNALFNLEHQHSDGTWATMEPELDREAHDPADLDPEKEWDRGHVYVCRSCQERIRVTVREGSTTTG